MSKAAMTHVRQRGDSGARMTAGGAGEAGLGIAFHAVVPTTSDGARLEPEQFYVKPSHVQWVRSSCILVDNRRSFEMTDLRLGSQRSRRNAKQVSKQVIE